MSYDVKKLGLEADFNYHQIKVKISKGVLHRNGIESVPNEIELGNFIKLFVVSQDRHLHFSLSLFSYDDYL
jgi:hypothetical protein